MNINNQILRINKKIIQVKNKNLEIFGSKSHQYKLNPPISLKEVEKFEKINKIELPFEYKFFLTKIGNGGLGPYYGIYKLNPNYKYQWLSLPCNLKSNISNHEWKILTSFIDDENMSDEQYDKYSESLYQGMLRIGTQGCTYFSYIILNGKFKGRIVYGDTEFSKQPFFTYEKNFLDWYERWLNEIINNYDVTWFGTNMAGDDKNLMKIFSKNNNENTKTTAILSMHKLTNISSQTINFLENEYKKQSSKKIKNSILGILTKYNYQKAKPLLDKLLKSKNKKLIALQNINWYGNNNIEEAIEQINKLISLSDNPKIIITFINILMKGKKNEKQKSLIELFLNHKEEKIRRAAKYALNN